MAKGKPAGDPTPGDAQGPQAFVDLHREAPGDRLYGITELCQQFGITLRALRFYEDKGLLAPQRINGARVYTRRDRARLALILRGKNFGMPLAEIKRLLDMYGDHGEGHAKQLGYVIGRLDEAIADMEAKRVQIDATLAELRVINDNCKRQLAARKRAGR